MTWRTVEAGMMLDVGWWWCETEGFPGEEGSDGDDEDDEVEGDNDYTEDELGPEEGMVWEDTMCAVVKEIDWLRLVNGGMIPTRGHLLYQLTKCLQNCFHDLIYSREVFPPAPDGTEIHSPTFSRLAMLDKDSLYHSEHGERFQAFGSRLEHFWGLTRLTKVIVLTFIHQKPSRCICFFADDWVWVTIMLVVVLIRGITSAKQGDGYRGSLADE
ncbi:hypothetical protein CPC08DRAFT_780294 [Agrocybe pediades]|nr:hypothetical protein CPC08DRAFT_780294 [Agrocybe pediades]